MSARRDSHGRFIKDTDHGFDALFKRAAKSEDLVVTVGVQGAKGEEDHGGISTVRLAGVHEFGAVIQMPWGNLEIPERSFMRSTCVVFESVYKDLIKKAAHSVLIGKLGVRQALGLIGERISSDMKKAIESGIPPSNAQSTIDKKGSSKQLFDHGQLKNSISYEVKDDDHG